MTPTPDELRRRFPAKFTPSIIDAIVDELAANFLHTGVLLDPFAGIGGIHQLADRLPCTTIGIDIEPEQAALHPRTIHGNSRYATRHVTELWVAAGGPPLDLTVSSRLSLADAIVTSPAYGNRLCLAAGTLVTTWEGPVPIEHVQPGMRVLTHLRRWREVTGAWCSGSRPTVTVVGQGTTLRCTPDHRILTARKGDGGIHAIDWRPASESAPRSDVTAGSAYRFHYWATPARLDVAGDLPPQTPRGPAVWWGVGFYLGNGSVGFNSTHGHASTVLLSKDLRHADAIADHMEDLGAKRRPDQTGLATWHLYDGLFAEWLSSTFGHSAYTKTVPGWCLGLSFDERSALLDGWLAADGCERSATGRRSNVAVSVSPGLISGMRLIAASIGRSSGYASRPASDGSIMGAPTRFAESHRLDVHDSISRKAHLFDGSIWYAIRSVEPADPCLVYDLEVADDHSFIANGVTVHNSDQYLGSDNEKCRPCNGTGWIPDDPDAGPDGSRSGCPACTPEGGTGGTGKARSRRMGYAIALGRRLTSGSGAAMAWGPKYRSTHQAIINEVDRLLKPGGFWLVNISSVIIGEQYQGVMEWWVEQIAARAQLVKLRPIETPRLQFGANWDARVPVEHLIVAQKRAG